MIRPMMTPAEARQALALIAKAKGVEPRVVQDEAERRKVQRTNGVPVNIGDEYISLEDVKRGLPADRRQHFIWPWNFK